MVLPAPENPSLLKPQEAAALLRCNYRRVLDLIAAGEFPNAINNGGSRNGARYLIPRSDVDRYLKSRRIRRAA